MAKHNYSYGSGTKKKRRLADSITNQAGLGGAYNSSSKPSKSDPNMYVPVPVDPTQAPRRQQSGRRKASALAKTTYASMARKRRRRTGDNWIG